MTSSEPNEAALRREVSALRARVAQLERGQDEQTEAALTKLCEQGVARRLPDGRFVHRDALGRAVSSLRQRLSA